MTDENLGLAIALQLIAQEASERSGSLDLGRLRGWAVQIDAGFRQSRRRHSRHVRQYCAAS
jgi:hypothetical protein